MKNAFLIVMFGEEKFIVVHAMKLLKIIIVSFIYIVK